MIYRPRRNRKSAAIRSLVEETKVSTDDLILPLFLLEDPKAQIEVKSMPGVFRLGIDKMLKEIEECLELGVKAFDIFPVVDESHKDKLATKSYDNSFFYQQALKKVKETFPEACVMTDVAMDPYSSDGHDGIVDDNGNILNDESLEIIGKMALSQAQSGADIIGPSDMMDGRIGHIRDILDANGYTDVSIMSYTAKYASAFYGPFRDALDSAPKSGDKKTYQMNPANVREALIEADLDVQEGADFLMVKPALAYLDIIKILKDNYNLPIAAYHVSGEYSMLLAAAQNGWLDKTHTMNEMLISMKRAGADIILTYFAKEFAQLRKEGKL
ncbi:porphobilinogen synthase [Fulvivirga sediminis]|uniref:Delta-aminolevulinic acid dehydratase n=1 Tax=Fulvivirga sediminis TaxID=2803949 RepID=A0A937F9G6_9BACT|nr:porphobilinogen synthase [Fulvivirga sediminis]MBL3657074.1 porphobilinogen synthase [Fulvivirga sediminis]